MKEKEEIVKVNCNYCGKEIECPINMLNKVDKHACINCFNSLNSLNSLNNQPSNNKESKIHIDIPLNEALDVIADKFTDKMFDDIFPKMWAEHKGEIKEMSKKELAERMFSEGVYLGFIGAFAYPGEETEDKETSSV